MINSERGVRGGGAPPSAHQSANPSTGVAIIPNHESSKLEQASLFWLISSRHMCVLPISEWRCRICVNVRVVIMRFDT
jgi:hypothetical protein